MGEWRYDPADFDQAQIERVDDLMRGPGPLVGGVRLLAAGVVRSWLRLYHRLSIVGRHYLPADRSFVMIANHASHLDTLCLLAALPFDQLNGTFPAAAQDYFCVNALRSMAAAIIVNAVPFDRQFAPWHSLSMCGKLLQKAGNVLIFFPEGARSAESEPGPFKAGAALLAAGRDVPVVPCHLAGTHAALPKGAWFPRPKSLRLTIGAPRYYSHMPATKESAQRICRELRDDVIALGNAGGRSQESEDRSNLGACSSLLTP